MSKAWKVVSNRDGNLLSAMDQQLPKEWIVTYLPDTPVTPRNGKSACFDNLDDAIKFAAPCGDLDRTCPNQEVWEANCEGVEPADEICCIWIFYSFLEVSNALELFWSCFGPSSQSTVVPRLLAAPPKGMVWAKTVTLRRKVWPNV